MAMPGADGSQRSRERPVSRSSQVVASAAVALLWLQAEPAYAYIGPSFLEVPGLSGGWRGATYKGWVRLEAHYWGTRPRASPPLFQGQKRTRFSAPVAPRSGAGTLAVALDKSSPAYAGLMDFCRRKATIPELTYAESSERARPPAELGRRPADIPEYFEYTLKNVTLSCPEAEGAPEQGIVLNFADIGWRNFEGEDRPLATPPAKLPPTQRSGRTLAYIVTWLNSANSVSPDQCPVMSAGPSEADYYRYRSEAQTAEEKAFHAPKGGVLASFIRGTVAYRGPGQLNVALLPGIVPDPGHPSPKVEPDRGVDLDGKRRGARATGAARIGEPGLDNRLFSVDGCIKGFGPTGILTVTSHEGRRNGEISMMLLVSGVDDERNDDRVDVTVFYSKDPMVKSASGKDILPGFTYRLSEDPERTPYFQRVRGRIVDGIVVTDRVDALEMDKGRDIARFLDGSMRLELKPDRTLKGVVAGYLDWRSIANYWGALTIFEVGMGYTVPGTYHALKRAADGLPDPVTGEFTGISTAFDIEGVQAYIPPEEEQLLLSAGLAYAK